MALFRILIVFMMSAVSGCGNGGNTSPAPSPPLVTWNYRTSGTTNHLFAVTYGNDLFVAVGDNGTIVTSRDGVLWEARSSGTNDGLKGIAYGNDLYVAVGDRGRILTSPDGIAWSDRSVVQPFTPFFTEISFGDGIFVASGVLAPYIYSFWSQDGATWINGDSGIHAIVFSNGIFLAVKTFVSVHGYPWSQTVVTSPDGKTWTLISKPDWPFDIRRIVYGKGLFVGIGGTSLGSVIITSTDGISWTKRHSKTLEQLFDVTYGNGFFVAAGNNGKILISSDGINWDNRKQSFPGSFSGVTYGSGTFVAVGSEGAIFQSDPL